MSCPCEMIRDLMPLYIDEVCSGESRAAVERHLAACAECRSCCEAMKASDGLYQKRPQKDAEDTRLAESLKRVKGRINKKIRNIALGAAAAVAAFFLGFNLLFVMPIKEIAPEDVSVSAEVYPIEELQPGLVAGSEEGRFRISAGEADLSDSYSVTIPAMPQAEIIISENLMEQNRYITVISWSSPYYIRGMEMAEGGDGDTLYVEAFKTTILNNRAPQSSQIARQLEIREINKIVYLDGEDEKVLWQNSAG